MPPPLISTDDLTVRYGRHLAVDMVTMTVQDGERVALVGPNGAGKSSLLRALVGLGPAQGRISFRGVPCHHRRATSVPFAYVPQASMVRADVPCVARDVVLTGRHRFRRRGWPYARADRDAAAEALAHLGIEHLANRPFAQLSGGQQQRTLLARALAQDPLVLLLDEPFRGLDRSSAAAVVDLLDDLAATGVAVLCATHDLALARSRFPRTIVLHRRVVADGPSASVLDAAGIERAFVGEAAA